MSVRALAQAAGGSGNSMAEPESTAVGALVLVRDLGRLPVSSGCLMLTPAKTVGRRSAPELALLAYDASRSWSLAGVPLRAIQLTRRCASEAVNGIAGPVLGCHVRTVARTSLQVPTWGVPGA